LKGIPKSKLGDQRVGPFEVVEKVGGLAYKLLLPLEWKIHPIVSVSQLEPAIDDKFDREQPPPPVVTVDGAEENEIQSIVRTAFRGRGRKKHYLVRWKGYRPEYDEWIPADEMEHSKDLVEEFETNERDKMSVTTRR
jgi:hypothetical protein